MRAADRVKGESDQQVSKAEADLARAIRSYTELGQVAAPSTRLGSATSADTPAPAAQAADRQLVQAVIWMGLTPGTPLPQNVFVAGGEAQRVLYVCRGSYGGGIYPGKVVANRCNVAASGEEIALLEFDVLINSGFTFEWTRASSGTVPRNAVAGGREGARVLYVCRTRYLSGQHPGSLVDGSCSIGYAGAEIRQNDFEVLTYR